MKLHSIRWKIIVGLSFIPFFIGGLIFYAHYRDILAHENRRIEHNTDTINRIILAGFEYNMIKGGYGFHSDDFRTDRQGA